VLYIWSHHYISYWHFKGNLRVQIQWTFNKAITIRILFCIYVHVTLVHVGVSTEIWGYRYSGNWDYWLWVRPSKLKVYIVYMSTLIQFLLQFQRNCRLQIQWILKIRLSQLEYCFVNMFTLIQFILEFQRKFEGTDTVDIENIDVQ
jgi:hypothetical protein